MKEVFLIIFAYLLGSIPTGVIVSRALRREDPRQVGSGNIGAANVMRVLGKKAGSITFLGDMAKGLIPTSMAIILLESPFWVSVVATFTLLGHLYPLFLNFKGGKGVATAGGIFLSISPLSFLLSGLLFGGVVYKWRYVSLGSLSATAALPVLLLLIATSKIYSILGLMIGCLIFYRHRENIKRLKKGEERKIGMALSP